MRRLVSVCVDFQDTWRRYLNDNHDAGEYVHIGLLAEWVVDRVAAGQDTCLTALFNEVEAIMEVASDDVENLIVIGLLEDIQLFALGKLTPKPATFDPDVVLRLLGPLSRRGWFKLIARYWDKYEPGRWRWQRSEEG